MKKKIFGLLLVVSLLFVTACSTGNSKLKDVAEKFNEKSDVKQAKEYGVTYEALVSGSTLTISVSGEDIESKKFEFKLDGDILSGDLNEDEIDYAAMSSLMLIDAIGQANGYKDGELYRTLNDERITSYTLDKEGLEIKADGGLHFKADITKKIPLLDFSNIYITKEDLEDAEEMLSNGSYYMNKGNVILSTFYDSDNYEVIIAEEGKLTSNAYNTLSSFLEIVFNDAAVSYLNDNYSITEGSKEFAGIKIDYDATLGEDEITLPSSEYKVMKVTIDEDAFLKAIR